MNKRILKKRVASLLLIFMMLLGVMTENENVLAENKKVDLHIINLSITDSRQCTTGWILLQHAI